MLLKPAPGGNVFFDFLEVKTEEKLLKNCFSFDQVKNQFGRFVGVIKNVQQLLFSNFPFSRLFF